MTPLVTLDQVKLRLRIDTDASDADLSLMIAGASIAVLAYIKAEDDAYLDPLTVPEDIQNAVLFLVGVMLRDPDGTESEKWQQGYLPFPVICMVYWRRELTLA